MNRTTNLRSRHRRTADRRASSFWQRNSSAALLGVAAYLVMTPAFGWMGTDAHVPGNSASTAPDDGDQQPDPLESVGLSRTDLPPLVGTVIDLAVSDEELDRLGLGPGGSIDIDGARSAAGAAGAAVADAVNDLNRGKVPERPESGTDDEYTGATLKDPSSWTDDGNLAAVLDVGADVPLVGDQLDVEELLLGSAPMPDLVTGDAAEVTAAAVETATGVLPDQGPDAPADVPDDASSELEHELRFVDRLYPRT